MVTVAEALGIGLDHHRAGRWAEAAAVYRQVLAFDPDQPDALHLLGLTCHQRGDWGGAIELIGRAIAGRADNPGYRVNLGNALLAAGRRGAAIDSFRRALSLDAGCAEAWNSLGLAVSEDGDVEGAARHFQSAVAAAPDYALAWNNLGVMRDQAGDPAGAALCYRRALALKLDYVEAHDHLGQVLVLLGRAAEAEISHRRALALAPNHAIAHSGLGSALGALGRTDEAITAYRAAITLDPSYAAARTNLGSVLHQRHRPGDAIAAHLAALALAPGLVVAYTNLAAAYTASGLVDLATVTCRRLIELKPGYAQGHNNLGIALQAAGCIAEATDSYRRALALDPDYAGAHINLIFARLYDPQLRSAELGEEIAAFARRHAPAVARRRFANPRDPERRLRIGYLSANLRESPTGLNLEPLYAHHDHERFEIVSYAQGAIADDMTARFRAWSDVWRPIAGLSDAAVADLIRGDGIDVLVSVAGWFDGNRPLVCAGRAAPVQVSYYDAASSGLAAMDYWLSDGFLHPAGTVDPHTEELVRVPHLLAYGVPEGTPAVGPVPSQGPAGPGFGSGRVRFGSCNNPAKIGRAVIGVWGRILAAVPGSVMVLKYLNWYGNAGVRGRYERAFGDVGIGPDRLEFDVAGGDRGRHLGFVTGIDVGLDPWPFNGCTTTFEALWMGVPVVTLAGERYVSRMSGSLLHTLGLGDLIARDEDGYVGTAVSLAGDVGRRAALRGELRGRLRGSLICAGPAYAGSLEAAYRGLWRRWCDGDG
jgi:predicted O-linked N-acetylglucosamine transferase (SPINDLY family)